MAPTLNRRSGTLNGPSVSCGLLILVAEGCLLEHSSGDLLQEYLSHDGHLLLRRQPRTNRGGCLHRRKSPLSDRFTPYLNGP